MYGHTDLKKGVVIELENAPYQVVESSHMAMGRGGAVMRTKLKNLLNGSVLERTFRPADKIKRADISKVNMQFLYRDGDSFHFMDQVTYEQIALSKTIVSEAADYLAEDSKAIINYFNAKPIGIELPNAVYLKVTKADPGAKGDTANQALKPSRVETGLSVMVPLFINEGDVVKVDTRSGAYLERQK
ncbi:MAG TPA: elongation factor P [Candidatus Dormibacteraeota bacterium]|nr:elongation factor P [Candidatus Dormibacteraeota bacterium]